MTSSDRAVALVTGANRGIGFEVARQLRDAGLTVAVGARGSDAAEHAVRDLGGDHLVPVRLDVMDGDGVLAAVDRVTAELGRLDVVVNNAAIDYDTDQRPSTADLERVRAVLDTNVLGAWRVTQAALPWLRRSPSPRVVNVSSESGAWASLSGSAPGYSVSKTALNALTVMLANELRSADILVNAVCPGWTATDMGQGGRPVRDGAASVVWAALLPDDGPTGGFFRDGRRLRW